MARIGWRSAAEPSDLPHAPLNALSPRDLWKAVVAFTPVSLLRRDARRASCPTVRASGTEGHPRRSPVSRRPSVDVAFRWRFDVLASRGVAPEVFAEILNQSLSDHSSS